MLDDGSNRDHRAAGGTLLDQFGVVGGIGCIRYGLHDLGKVGRSADRFIMTMFEQPGSQQSNINRLSFLSPKGTGLRINIWFANPLDGGPPISDPDRPRCLWQRTGDTFETLTLSPSVDASPDWHGWIRNGEMVGC